MTRARCAIATVSQRHTSRQTAGLIEARSPARMCPCASAIPGPPGRASLKRVDVRRRGAAQARLPPLPGAGHIEARGCYVGLREPTGATVTRPDGSVLALAPSLAVRNHSPTGFEWGYLGSGPAQLALALLLDHTGDADTATRLYQRFKDAHVARWRGKVWALAPAELSAWLAEAEAER